MGKKCLMMIHTRFQLLAAFHIKRKMLDPGVDVDILLIGNQLGYPYAVRLKDFFDRVYIAERDYYSQREQIKYYNRPSKALCKFGIEKPEKYTDVFFYNPGWIYYYLKKFELKSGKNYSWHILLDGNAGYLFSLNSDFFIFHEYGNSVLQRAMCFFDRKMWNRRLFLELDEYLWSSNMKVCSCEHKLVEVPRIDIYDKNEIGELNYIFNYMPCHDFDNAELIYLDGAFGYGYDEYLEYWLNNAVCVFGKKMIVVPHPSTDSKYYEKYITRTTFTHNQYPWELICINQNLKEKILIGPFTGALTNPMLISNICLDTYSFYSGIKCSVNKWEFYSERYRQLMKKVSLEYPSYHCVETMDELRELNSIAGGKNK